MFDIENDPKERSNIGAANTGIGYAVVKTVGAPMRSLKKHPNLKTRSGGIGGT
jgi:hypothetical protein